LLRITVPPAAHEAAQNSLRRLPIVAEEADESEYWLGILIKLGHGSEQATRLLGEAGELTAIFAAFAKTAKSRK
jgi:four helix bundle protein